MQLIKNKKGFSIIELSISLIVFFISSFLFYSLLVKTGDISHRTKQFYEFIDIKRQVYEIVSNEGVCTDTLNNQSVNVDIVSPTSFAFKNKQGGDILTVAGRTDPWVQNGPTFRIVTVRIASVNPLPQSNIDTRILASLNVTYQKRMESGQINEVLSKNPLYLSVRITSSTATVLNCRGGVVDNHVFGKNCPAGELLQGFDMSGDPVCILPPPPSVVAVSPNLFRCPNEPSQKACYEVNDTDRNGNIQRDQNNNIIKRTECCPTAPPLSECQGNFSFTSITCRVAIYSSDPTEAGIIEGNRRRRCFAGFDFEERDCEQVFLTVEAP